MSSAFSYIYGGVETVVFELSERLAGQGHEVYILSGQGKKAGPKGVRLMKLPFIRSEYFQKLPLIAKIFPANEFEGLSLLPFALLCLMGINPDIVLSNQLAETLPAQILYIPLVMFSQAPIKLRFNAFKKADRVIVNDFQSYATLKKHGIKAELIFNGVNKSITPKTNLKELRAKYNVSSMSKVILTVARLDANKRINLVIDAFKLIKQDATLIIVGDGAELASLKKQASTIKSGNKIIFIKPMPYEQLKELYQLCDVFTLPSELEGFSLVILEALCFGKTAVTNPAPVKKFILGEFGVFTNVEDPKEYSRSLLQAASKKIDMNSADYIHHMQKFDWNRIAQQYVKIFRDVLQKREPAGLK